MAPLEVESYGAMESRLSAGEEIDEQSMGLMNRALQENAVIVAQVTTFDD